MTRAQHETDQSSVVVVVVADSAAVGAASSSILETLGVKAVLETSVNAEIAFGSTCHGKLCLPSPPTKAGSAEGAPWSWRCFSLVSCDGSSFYKTNLLTIYR